MFPVRGGGLSIYTDGYGFWVGNFHQKKNPFGKNLYILVLFFFLWKPEKIWSGASIAEGLACSLLMTKIGSDLNFILKVIKYTKVWPGSTLYCRSGTSNVLYSREKTRTVKSHLPNAAILIAPRSAQPAASCPERHRSGAMGWKMLFSLLVLLAWEKA